MSEHPPVKDWKTDFDHVDPDFARDPYSVYSMLQKECPIAHTDRYGGMWVPTKYEDLAAIAHDTEHFSSSGVFVSDVPTGTYIGPLAAPITSDPPYHTKIRRLLLPAFAPGPINALEGHARDVCRSLIDKFIDAGECDAAVDYAQHIPVALITKILGVPDSDGDLFRSFIHRILEEGPADPDELVRAAWELLDYLRDQVEAHKKQPREDLISYLLSAEYEGEKLEEHEVLGVLVLQVIAGIDTTWSAIGSALWHLATHEADRKRLVAEPELMPTAIEEFLRYYSPVTMARRVVADIDFKGCPMKEGDRVLLPFPAGNRDPDAFEDADDFKLDRKVNRHYAFGVGIHRCLGSNLARMELRVALEEWLARIPEFYLTDPEAVTWSRGQVRGPRRIPVAWPTSA